VFALTSCLNRDVQLFYRKWIDDIRDAQLPNAGYAEAAPISAGRDSGPAGAAGVLVPWALYRCYDDRSGLDAHVTSMGRWVDAAVAKNTDLIWRKDLGTGSGDPLESGPGTDPSLLATAELAYASDALAQMLLSGGPALAAEGERFQKLARASRAAFNAEFVLPNGKLKSDTQTAYALAIARGLLEPEAQARAGQYLAAAVERAQGRATTGTLGTALLLPALSRLGRDDLAYALLRSFIEPNAVLPRGLELGALGEWMYDAIGGIALDPAAPAGRHVLMRPRPGGKLTRARASFASLYGPIGSAWSLAGGTFRLKVTIPVGSTATVWMPYPGAVSESNAPAEKSSGVTSVTPRATGSVLELTSGSYELSVAAP
jgi:alpha-L-rhamnosidase